MKKIIIISLMVLLLSGCKIDYTINLNEDMTYNEHIVIEEDNDFYQLYDVETTKKMIDSYTNHKSVEGNKTIITLDKSNTLFSSIEENEYLKEYVTKIEIEEGTNYSVKIFLNDKFKELLNGDGHTANKVGNLKLKINFPFEVVKANNTSKEGNTYVWEMAYQDTLDAIYFVFDNPKKLQANLKKGLKILIMCGTFIVFGGLAFYINAKFQKK